MAQAASAPRFAREGPERLLIGRGEFPDLRRKQGAPSPEALVVDEDIDRSVLQEDGVPTATGHQAGDAMREETARPFHVLRPVEPVEAGAEALGNGLEPLLVHWGSGVWDVDRGKAEFSPQ